MSMVHTMARTTPRTRSEIHESKAALTEVSQTYNISVGTARKWRNRSDHLDRAHQMNTTLGPAQVLRTYDDQTERSSVDFLCRVHKAVPFRISKLLTDNGTQFTDRFTSKDKQPTGTHAFDKQCKALNIEHRWSPPRHPQTNGMVERFNGRISEVVQQTRFASGAELQATLNNYMLTYNHHITQRALGHLSPVDALKSWHKKKPALLLKRV